MAIRVVLVGFMGAGKTTVGKLLAGQLRCLFIDLDNEIVDCERRPIPQIFRESGEPGFRKLERSTLRSLITSLDHPDLDRAPREEAGYILAVGGGAYSDAENAALLRQYGWTSVFLDAPIDELRRRCAAEAADRPLARDENHFRQLYEARRGSYMAADLRVDTAGKTPGQVAQEIAGQVLLFKRQAKS